MTDRDDLQLELDALLLVDVPDTLVPGVRRQIAARRRNVWLASGAGLMAAAAGLALMLSVPGADQVASTEPVPVRTASVPSVALAPTPATPSSVVSAVRPLPSRPPATRLAAVQVNELSLEVITSQPALLRRMWAAPADRGVSQAVSALDGPMQAPAPGFQIVLAPLVVEPIVISEIGKENGRAGAPQIRRIDAARETR